MHIEKNIMNVQAKIFRKAFHILIEVRPANIAFDAFCARYLRQTKPT